MYIYMYVCMYACMRGYTYVHIQIQSHIPCHTYIYIYRFQVTYLVSDASVLRSHIKHLAHIDHGALRHELLTRNAPLRMMLDYSHTQSLLLSKRDEPRLCACSAKLVFGLACVCLRVRKMLFVFLDCVNVCIRRACVFVCVHAYMYVCIHG